MRIFYCPQCGDFKMEDNPPLRNKITYKNLRDGYGRPITHYKCECGNYLAGSMSISGWEDDLYSITYCKDVIKGYNKGGCYYSDGLYEAIEKRYEENIKQGF